MEERQAFCILEPSVKPLRLMTASNLPPLLPEPTSPMQDLLRHLPQQPPFRFFDEVLQLSETHIEGAYTFRPDEYFYAGHFPQHPVTPGVILIECMAQVALLGLGIHLMLREGAQQLPPIAFSSSEVAFLRPVYPGERVQVRGEKVYYRLRKLKVQARMTNAAGATVAKGTLAGMIVPA